MENTTLLGKIKLILNPTANHGRSLQAVANLRPLMANHNADWVWTEYQRHATELARQAGEQGYDLVAALGGDGTVHEVINGLMQVPEETRPALGIVPLGSGNDFAHILGIPADPGEALLSAVNGQPHSLDVGSVCDENNRLEYFNNTIGMGFDALVNMHTRKITAIHGFMMYFVALMRTIFRNFDAIDLHVETDQETWDLCSLMLALGNCPREGGGFIITPDAKWDDGLLNYVTIKKISRLMMLRLVPEVMRGTHGRFKQVRMGNCRRMSVTSKQPLYIHCDGEIYAGFGTDVRKLTIQIIPNSIHFLKT
ncbi:MAG: diacylglycerol kinase family protein [Anaerolineales bacterium]|jgi:YegS/Rv2252/BmrU family lipid kinase